MSNFFSSMATGKPSCSICGLHKTSKIHKMPLIGKGKKGIFILSGAPSETEEERGLPMVGNSGKFFAKVLGGHGIDMEEDCWRTTAIRCRVPEQKDELKFATKCQKSIEKMIKDCKPKKIILLGTIAIASFYADCPEVTKSLGPNKGLSFWDSRYNCWVFPMYPPSLWCETKDQLLIADAKRVLANAIEHYEGAPAIPEPVVRKLIVLKDVLDYLQWLIDTKPKFAFDYESTGLKPQHPGHKIVSIGIATEEGAVSFPFQHPFWKKDELKQIKDKWAIVLADNKIKKIVQAMNMEYVWSTVIVGPMKGLIWDTQLASHVLDNREGEFYGLKFQSFLRWGVRNYSTLDSYIKAKNGAKFNEMEKAPIDALLTYNGLDALYTYHIWKNQQYEFEGRELDAYLFYHRGLTVLGEMHMNGIRINRDHYLTEGKKIELEIAGLLNEIQNTDEVKEFEKKFRRKFSASSGDDIIDLFYNMLNFKAVKKTAKNKDSVDEEALKQIDHPIAATILQARKLEKINGTYISGFLREEVNGFMYPVFSLHRVTTFRSSSSSPNFQNISKRDKKAKKITRSGLIPRPGCVICEGDFSGAEVSVSAMYHQDRNFINYLLDKENSDMHRDCAKELWILKEIWDSIHPDIAKSIRQNTKSDWTFAEFYGSYWKKCAVAMWKKRHILIFPETKTTLESHLSDKGIKTEAAFFKHVEAFETKFWGTMFPEYAAWKKQNVRDYLKNGYVETYLGFRFKGWMNDREVNNYQTQGTSFHLLLYTAYILNRELRKRGMKTLLIGQIHDSIIADIPIGEVPEYCRLFKSLLENLPKTFPWMIVPISAEIEISRPDYEGGSFAELEQINLDEIEHINDYSEIIYVKTMGEAGEILKNAKRIAYKK